MGKHPQVMELQEFKRLAFEVGTPPAAPVKLIKDYVSEVKGIEGQDRVLAFTISTGVIDRDGDTIAVDGWDLSNFQENPVVLFAHDYGSLPVARALETCIEGGRLRSRAEFTPRDLYPFGYLVYEMYREGFIRASSVGFRPKTWARNNERGGWMPTDFQTQELLEWSCVPVPANPEALMAAKASGLDMAPMVEWAGKVLDGQRGEKGLWVPRHVVERIHDLLAPEKAFSVPAVPAGVVLPAGAEPEDKTVPPVVVGEPPMTVIEGPPELYTVGPVTASVDVDTPTLHALVSRLEAAVERLAAIPAAPHTPEKAPGPEFLLELADDPASAEPTVELEAQALRDTLQASIQREVQRIRQAITGRLPS